jgi:hypothetical protein
MANAVLEAVGRGIGAAIERVLGEVSQFLTQSSTPQVTVDSFVGKEGAYHQVAQLAALLMILFIFLGVIQGALAGDPLAMIGRTLRNVPLAALSIFGFPWLVEQLVSLVDAVCASLLPTGDTFGRIARVYLVDGLFTLPGIIVQLFVFLGGVAIYAELVVRAALVTLVVALSPLSFAAMVWPAARGAARKIAELVTALILSKLAIWVAISVGLSLFETHTRQLPPGGTSWGQMIAGSAILAVAVFAPFVVWRLIPVAEAAMIAQGVSRMPGRAAMGAVMTGNMLRGRGGGRGGGSAGGEDHPALADLPSRSIDAPGGGGSSVPGAGTAASSGAGGMGAASAAPGGIAAPAAAAVHGVQVGKDRVVSSAQAQANVPTAAAPAADGWKFQRKDDGR